MSPSTRTTSYDSLHTTTRAHMADEAQGAKKRKGLRLRTTDQHDDMQTPAPTGARRGLRMRDTEQRT